MNHKVLKLATRHGALKARIDEQRRLLGQHVVPIEQALAKGDQVLKGVDWLKHHPAAIGLAVTAAVVARPRRVWRLAQRSFFLWRGWQAVKKSLARVG